MFLEFIKYQLGGGGGGGTHNFNVVKIFQTLLLTEMDNSVIL